MNEFKRCLNVFTHTPFQVRMKLIAMIVDMVSSKSQNDQKPQS